VRFTQPRVSTFARKIINSLYRPVKNQAWNQVEESILVPQRKINSKIVSTLNAGKESLGRIISVAFI
jgi:hypothetical protein